MNILTMFVIYTWSLTSGPVILLRKKYPKKISQQLEMFQTQHGGCQETEEVQRVHQRPPGVGDEVWEVLPGVQANSEDLEEWEVQACHNC